MLVVFAAKFPISYLHQINWLDVWTGHALAHEAPGAALARTKARLGSLELEHALLAMVRA
jgi:hypothetical protein